MVACIIIMYSHTFPAYWNCYDIIAFVTCTLICLPLANLKCCRYTCTVVAKKRNKVAYKNETSGKNEFLMQIVNSNVEESMFTLVMG